MKHLPVCHCGKKMVAEKIPNGAVFYCPDHRNIAVASVKR